MFSQKLSFRLDEICFLNCVLFGEKNLRWNLMSLWGILRETWQIRRNYCPICRGKQTIGARFAPPFSPYKLNCIYKTSI